MHDPIKNLLKISDNVKGKLSTAKKLNKMQNNSCIKNF